MLRKLGLLLASLMLAQSAAALELSTNYFKLNTNDQNWMQIGPVLEKDGNFNVSMGDANLDTLVTVTVTPGTFGAEAAAYATVDRMKASRLTTGPVENLGNGIFRLNFTLKDGTHGTCYFKDDGTQYGVINILGKDHALGYQLISMFTDVDYTILPKVPLPQEQK